MVDDLFIGASVGIQPVTGESVMVQWTTQNNYTTIIPSAGYFIGMGQAFTADGGTISSLTFWLQKVGAVSGDYYFRIYSATAGPPYLPDTLLASSAAFQSGDIDPDSLQQLNKALSTPYATTNGVKYCAVVEYTGSDTGNLTRCGEDTGAGAPLNWCLKDYTAGTWSNAGELSATFIVYKQG